MTACDVITQAIKRRTLRIYLIKQEIVSEQLIRGICEFRKH